MDNHVHILIEVDKVSLSKIAYQHRSFVMNIFNSFSLDNHLLVFHLDASRYLVIIVRC